MTTEHIKIGDITPRVRYTANGVLSEYSFSFPIFNETDIKVYFNDNLQETNYSISGVGNSNGGSVIFNTPPTNETIITILRDLSIKRTTDFQEGGAFRANVINDELDYQTACIQQISDNISRTVTIPPYAADNIDMTLPTATAGKALIWNSNATGLENSIENFNEITQTISNSVDETINAKDITLAAKNEAITAKDTAVSIANNINLPNITANTYLKAKSDASGYEAKSIGELAADINKGYINGLDISYLNSTSMQISTGVCLSDDNSTMLSLTSNTNAVLSSATANTTYHLFLGENNILEFAQNINGSDLVNITGAKRRIASFITDGSANLRAFNSQRTGNKVRVDLGSSGLILFNATSSLPTSFADLFCAVPTGLNCNLTLATDLVSSTDSIMLLKDKTNNLSPSVNRTNSSVLISKQFITFLKSDNLGTIQHKCTTTSVDYNYTITLLGFEYEV